LSTEYKLYVWFSIIVRLQEEFDLSTTVKFVYIHWIGNKVPFTKKGRYGIVHGAVVEKFGVSIHITELNKLTNRKQGMVYIFHIIYHAHSSRAFFFWLIKIIGLVFSKYIITIRYIVLSV
jgi:hypothetical protein